MKSNNITIIIIIVVLVLLVGIIVLVWWGGKEVKFSSEEYANQKGFEKYFQYQNQWYANVDGKWEPVGSKEEARQLVGLSGEK